MLDFFTTALHTLDPDVHDLINFEAERQARKIIMIPSESQAPEAVREALGSVFQNIYAEGYPNPDTHALTQSQILDYSLQLARYRRLGDERYYKASRCDVMRHSPRPPRSRALRAQWDRAGSIWPNVQPLSRLTRNSPYTPLWSVGATVRGMTCLHGGHPYAW